MQIWPNKNMLITFKFSLCAPHSEILLHVHLCIQDLEDHTHETASEWTCILHFNLNLSSIHFNDHAFIYIYANIGQRNWLVPERGEFKQAYLHQDPQGWSQQWPRPAHDFLEFTRPYCIRDCHVTYVTLRWSLTNRASNSPVLPQSEQETVLRSESSQVSKFMLCKSA